MPEWSFKKGNKKERVTGRNECIAAGYWRIPSNYKIQNAANLMAYLKF